MQARIDLTSLRASTRYPHALRLGTSAAFGWLLFHTLFLLPDRTLLWGPTSVIAPMAYPDGLLNNLFFHLVYAPGHGQSVFFIHLLCAGAGIFHFRGVEVFRGIAWLSGCMLYFAAHPAFNSGFLLTLLLAFYTIVVQTRASSWWRILLNNVAWMAVLIQVLLVYAAASWFKLSGEMWPGGSALYYSLHMDYLSNDVLVGEGLKKSKGLLKVLTYAGLIYQVIFPVMIFVGRWRGWWLLAGVFFHLAIGLFLNLWDFATAMLCAYVFFISENTCDRVLRFLRINKTARS